jgi:formate-dependent nitrite reductase membrane component NrfD
MSPILVALQLLLLLPALPLAVMSHRTSRSQRARHNSFVAVGSLVGLLAAVLALVSLALVLGGDDTVDPVLSFVPPLFTLLACGKALHRGLSQSYRRSRRARTPSAR